MNNAPEPMDDNADEFNADARNAAEFLVQNFAGVDPSQLESSELRCALKMARKYYRKRYGKDVPEGAAF